MGTSSKSRDWSPPVSVSCAGRIDEPPAFFVHAASIPVAVGLTVFSTGANRLEVPTTVSANAFLEFGHMSFSIYKHFNVDVPLVIRAEFTSLVRDLPETISISKTARCAIS